MFKNTSLQFILLANVIIFCVLSSYLLYSVVHILCRYIVYISDFGFIIVLHCTIQPTGYRNFNKRLTYLLIQIFVLLARDAFVRTNHRAIAMMFAHLSVCMGRACIVTIRCTLARI